MPLSHPSPPLVHFVICTHTPRGLARTLLGAAAPHRLSAHPPPITVSTDGDDPAIAAVVAESAARLAMPVTLVQRAHTGRSRSSQVRNNAVRAILADRAPDDPTDPILIFLDGDCVPAPDLAEVHASLCAPRTLVLGFRIDLDAAQTDRFDDDALARGRPPVQPSPAQIRLLDRRHRRYARQAALRRLGLAKPHKPKLLSANFSVRLSDFTRVNGFDEAYEGYGQEDDDLGRRLYRAGCRPVIAIRRAIAYHQHHTTRAPGDWHDSPNAARFAAGGPVRCILGLDRPIDQPPVRITRCGPPEPGPVAPEA